MKLRVLQVSKEFHPQSSGVARHIQGLARALATDAALELRLLAPSVDVAAAPCPAMAGGYRQLWASLGDCDVVHVHGARTLFAAVAALLARWRRRPVIYTPHCYYDTGSPWRRGLKRLWDLVVERFLVRSAGVVVLLHQGWVDDLARRGLYPRRILLVPNCIAEPPAATRAEAPPLEGRPALLSIGRLDPIKRLDDAIVALRETPLCEAVLHLVGQGDDRTRLEALALRLDVAARVRFHGWQDDATTAGMMGRCAAMLLASEREGMPTVVLEALLAGVPIACSNIEGNGAILEKVGWEARFALGDVAALARCAAHTAQRTVPTEVRQAVRAHFTWEGEAPRLAAIYAELTAVGS